MSIAGVSLHMLADSPQQYIALPGHLHGFFIQRGSVGEHRQDGIIFSDVSFLVADQSVKGFRDLNLAGFPVAELIGVLASLDVTGLWNRRSIFVFALLVRKIACMEVKEMPFAFTI
ncbi:hypothetical protein FACS1894196_3310 [Clostridia bacterium]|nr:hypothetical protein FACS1894196_3310 [Clostridia bacterium]